MRDDLPGFVRLIVRNTAWRTLRYAPQGFEIDDFFQIGCLAAWESREQWQRLQHPHADCYIQLRASGAMLDAIRRSFGGRGTGAGRAQIHFVDELPDTTAGPDDPVADAYMAQVLRRLDALPHPYPLIVRRCVEGVERQDIAAELGVSPSSISKRLTMLQQALGKFFLNP